MTFYHFFFLFCPLDHCAEAILANSQGLAIIITCDYETTKDLKTLLGTREDGEQMKETFHYLKYKVYHLSNPKKGEIKELLEKLSDDLGKHGLGEKEGSEKAIVFAFSGHGCSKGQIEYIYTNDGGTLEFLDEIVFPLTRRESVQHVPKLFFMDACRGGEILMKGTCPSVTDDRTNFQKGYQHVLGNYYIAYATIPHHVAYANASGSRWMPKIAKAIREEDDSFQNIAAKVMAEVNKEVSDTQQQCESINRLNTGPLYLKRLS